MKNIFLNKSHKKYFLLQRNNYLSKTQKKIRRIFGRYLFTNFFVNYFNSISEINHKLNKDFSQEFEELLEYLPPKANFILDIGAGLGIIDIYLNDYYTNNVNFTLIDKDKIEKKVKYGFDESGQAYNSINLTKSFLIQNGISQSQSQIINADKQYKITQKFDLIISLLSMGYHYPISQYINICQDNTHDKTVFIFDIANEYNDFDEINNMFEKVEVIKKSFEIRHNYQRICCTGYKKSNNFK